MGILNWVALGLAAILTLLYIVSRVGWVHSPSPDDFLMGLVLVGIGHQFILAKDIGFLKGKAHSHKK